MKDKINKWILDCLVYLFNLFFRMQAILTLKMMKFIIKLLIYFKSKLLKMVNSISYQKKNLN